jgi:hypothetical protein
MVNVLEFIHVNLVSSLKPATRTILVDEQIVMFLSYQNRNIAFHVVVVMSPVCLSYLRYIMFVDTTWSDVSGQVVHVQMFKVALVDTPQVPHSTTGLDSGTWNTDRCPSLSDRSSLPAHPPTDFNISRHLSNSQLQQAQNLHISSLTNPRSAQPSTIRHTFALPPGRHCAA